MDKYSAPNPESRLDALVAEYMPLIARAASRFDVSSLGLGREDLELEGMMGLLRAARTWLPDRGASFSTYASRCINNAISSAAASAARDKHLPLNTGLPLDEGLPEPAADSPESLADALETRATLLGVIAAELSSYEREALTLHLAGYDVCETAEKLSRTNKSVENALARARYKVALKAAELFGDLI